MLKRMLLIGLGLLLIAVGFATFRHISYQNSPDRIADEFVHDLTANNIDAIYDKLADSLKESPKEFWQEQDFVRELAGYDGSVRRLVSEPARSTDPAKPDPYTPTTEAHRYIYEFYMNDLTYHLKFDIFRYAKDQRWQVNDVFGTYEAAT